MNTRFLTSSLFVFLAFCVFGQSENTSPISDFSSPTDMEIGGLKVKGNHHSETAAILSLSGLRVGDRVRVPGPATTQAVKNILRQGLFSEVYIVQEKKSGDVVFLEFFVTEKPRLSGHKFIGVKRGSMMI